MKSILTFALLLSSMILLGQETIITDRPDQTESPNAVPKGSFQLETGAFLSIEEGVDILNLNNSLLRFGLAKNFELRVITGINSVYDRFSEKSFLGIDDLRIGGKYTFIEDKVTFGMLAHMSIPSGSRGFSSEKVGFDARLSLAHGVTDKIGFGYNIGYEFTNKDEQALIYTYSIGFSVMDKLGAFAEIYGGWSDEFKTYNSSFDAGLTYLLFPNLQFDVSFGTGITQRNNFVSGGVSWLILKKSSE